MNSILKILFFATVVYPVSLIVLGLNIRRRELLPRHGPAIIVANHNSHLDALVLMTVFGLRRLKYVRPVAAADYFLKNRLRAWFSQNVIGIIPLNRQARAGRNDPLEPVCSALNDQQIVILFPEGTRGEPEKLDEFRTGVAHLAKRHPEVPFFPVFMHGLGKALPRGEGLLVPFFVDVFCGHAILWKGNKGEFMGQLKQQMTAMSEECRRPEWD